MSFGMYITLRYMHVVYCRSTYKDDQNKIVTQMLVKEVKGNNKSFLEADIRGIAKAIVYACDYFSYLYQYVAAVYTYYKSMSQEEALKRNGKHDQRKIQRRRRERIIRV